ncbi:MAG: superoxide dismutase [Lachnospiraceae bacterium]|nr:superoxide dismutase [Prevotella sp.]MCM1074456.1 superoxide dismutase [Ruminococcus sp.]MCM1221437.1 superoxide dismutase [Lachnospiraceae bacterium]
MKFTQPKLPYTPDALAPAISQETVDYHYGKHEKAYIDNLNRLIEGTELANEPLEEIIKVSEGPLFNNASQAWNHIFYFFQFSPDGKKAPEGALAQKIDETFGSLDEFKKKFEEAGSGIFGSGWVWLSADADGNLFLTQTQNAGNPMTEGLRPILVFDVWEHAYYLDYQNRRPAYLHALWDIVDWSVVETRYAG